MKVFKVIRIASSVPIEDLEEKLDRLNKLSGDTLEIEGYTVTPETDAYFERHYCLVSYNSENLTQKDVIR